MAFATISGLLVLLALTIPVAAVLVMLSLLLSNIASPMPLSLVFGDILWGNSASFILVVVPMFIMMGQIVLHAGVADRMYAALAQWLTWLPGRLMHANIAACALFAATSGSTTATAATVAVAALPQMDKRGYNERLFLGSIAAGGTLGILIPPSINMIVYAALTNTSITKLFMAGVIPGLILTALYMMVVLVICILRPEYDGVREESSWRRRLASLPDMIPPIVLFLLVIGSIYVGVATPTEAAAIGVIGSLGLAAKNGTLNFRMLGKVMEGTIRVSGMITLILMGAFVLNFVISSVGIVTQINHFIVGLNWGPIQTMLLIIGIYLILGMFMDGLPMVVLTVPVIAPVVYGLGFDPVWFGIVIVVVTEVGILTPPFGMQCFVVHGLRGRGEIQDVYYGVAPFLLALGVLIAMLLSFPSIALWLPGVMK